MHTLPHPESSPDQALQSAISREILRTLCASLPPLVTDTPEARAARDEAAMAAAIALHPADAMEATLAGTIVATEACAMDCFRLAGERRADFADTIRCRAQANAMLRNLRALMRDYRRGQAERDKALAAMHPAAMERAGYWFRDVSVPAPVPPPAPEAAAPPGAEPAMPAYETLSAAEQYAVIYPARAALIRASRGVPANASFGPPDPEIAEILVNGTSPVLRALDGHPAARATA